MHFEDNCQLCYTLNRFVLLLSFIIDFVSAYWRDEEESDDDDKSPRSEDPQSYSNPIRDDTDVKAKISEMNEEKRTKLREIEVLYYLPLPAYDTHWYIMI